MGGAGPVSYYAIFHSALSDANSFRTGVDVLIKEMVMWSSVEG